MAGHSKWANIKHRKGKQDALKGKVFTKLIREITVAARHGATPADNPRLRLVIDKALDQNMTRDTIDRAIKRGAGGDDDSNLMEVRYEGYGPGGVAVIVNCLSDNRNRTVADVRYMFTKNGGNLGTDGSVSYLFKQRGVLCFPPGSDEDRIMQVAIDAGADDIIINDDGSIDVLTAPEDYVAIKAAVEKVGLKPEAAELTMMASTQVALDQETAEKITSLIDALEELDDVQSVYSNAEFPS